MAAMARLNLSIPIPQIVWLQAEAERFGISAGELVRRIIDQHRDTQRLFPASLCELTSQD